MIATPFPSVLNRSAHVARILVMLGAVALLMPRLALATPYASGVTNNAGVVSFILNEAADNVTVVFDGGASSSDLGALGAGQHSFNLGAATSFAIEVRKASGPGYLNGVTNRISSETNSLAWFFSPRGVAVNRNPGSPNFGRVYVADAVAGPTTVPGARTNTDGIYMLNADLTDAIGQGDTARTGGVGVTPFGQNGNSFWKIEVGEDDSLYMADFSTNQGTIWITDASVTTTSNLLEGLGSLANPTVHTTISSSPVPLGSLGAGNLTVWAIDGRWPGAGNRNRLLRWDINGGPAPWNTAPTQLGSAGNGGASDVYCDVDRGPDGKLYVLQNRSNGTDTDSLRVFAPDGTTLLWGSLAQTGSPDTLRMIRAVKVNPDGNVIALNKDDGRTWIIRLTNGIPDMTSTNLLDTFVSGNSGGRDVAFDAAGNLYVINNNIERLRVFSPGGTTRAITRSDGTFTVVRPPPVSVTAAAPSGDPVATEGGVDNGVFSIYRSGDTAQPLTVHFTLTGTATNGVDYTSVPLTAIIPAGETNVIITIEPINDDESEPSETVVLTLVSTPEYDLSPPASALIGIVDNDPIVLTVTGNRTNAYEPLPIPLTLTIHRVGDTNLDVFISYSFSGTAVETADFQQLPFQLYLPAGQVSLSQSIDLIDDPEYEGDETVVFTLLPADIYTVGTPGSMTGVIRDNEYAPACVLFSDDFEVDSSANWITRFGANNGILDGVAEFSYDYLGLQGIPSAPHSAVGTTRGVFIQVNKLEATAGGAAAMNLYPAGQSFSGNYALRADMFLSFGAAATTEHAQLGLNQSGNFTNRVSQSAGGIPTTAGGDGIWVGIETDGSPNREYHCYTYPAPDSLPTIVTNRTAAAMAAVIPAPPYAFAGSPGNGPSNPKTWADVEFRQLDGVITLSVNGNIVYSFANTSGFSSGNVMLGMNDQFDSVGSPTGFVVFDNVQVVSLDFLIKSILLVAPDQVQIDFASPLGGLASEFRLQSGSNPASLADDNGAIITAIPGGFRAVTTQAGGIRFYRIRR